MQTTEVTQGQWEGLMGQSVEHFRNNESQNFPMWQINRGDAQAFIQKLNAKGEGIYRLPTEAEWEYAARAGTKTAYFFGDNAALLEKYAWFKDNSMNQSVHDVATKLPNPWGLYDMNGNLLEWVQDWYSSYSTTPVIDPKGPQTGSLGITRGGSGIDGPWALRSASRLSNGQDPNIRTLNTGFRVVRE